MRGYNSLYTLIVSWLFIILPQLEALQDHKQCNDCVFQERYPLQHCQIILQKSSFAGNCCSLLDDNKNHNMEGRGGGCTLQVSNGWCHVEGPYWSLTRNSTNSAMDCPPSDYKVPYRQFLLLGEIRGDTIFGTNHNHNNYVNNNDDDEEEEEERPSLKVSLWADHQEHQVLLDDDSSSNNNMNPPHNMDHDGEENNSNHNNNSNSTRKSASAISLLFSIGIATNFTSLPMEFLVDSI